MKPNDTPSTPNEFKQARLEAGLTQKEAAEKTGVTLRCIKEWEQGRRRPATAFVKNSYFLALKKA